MRMSVTINETLLEEARSFLGEKSKKAVIEVALSELVRKRRREEAIKHAGNINIDMTLEELLKIREEK